MNENDLTDLVCTTHWGSTGEQCGKHIFRPVDDDRSHYVEAVQPFGSTFNLHN